MFRSCRENQNTQFKFNICFRKSCRYWDIVEQCDTTRGHRWQYGILDT